MSTSKHFDRICCAILVVILIFTAIFMNFEGNANQSVSNTVEYENKLFDTSVVHTIDIVMDDWDDFISNCQDEEYYNCAVIIDDETYKNVAIRGKGNTSLTQVSSYGNDRYSFKIEFDHYDSSNTYHGLDKLCLNNIIQDNTYMKDYLTYQMMGEMGVASPLCSYVYIKVNGEDWGLYLAVESVEEAFLQRNYGNNYGDLYKPDSMSMGGGRGNGKGFDMDEMEEKFNNQTSQKEDTQTDLKENNQSTQENSEDNAQKFENKQQNFGDRKENNGGMGMMNASDDVLLKYIDDDVDSYTNIFDNAKTQITNEDKTRLIESLKNLSSGEDILDTVDVEKVIKYFVVHNFVLNFDSYTGSMIHNYYLYEKDGQMQMIPWDYNLAFGGFNSSTDATKLINYPIDSPVSNGDVSDRPMLAWIFESEEYIALYHEYFSEFISEYFDNEKFETMYDNVVSMISPYVEKDPTKFCTYEEFETGVSTLKEFCKLRAESISGQLDGTIGSSSDNQESDTLIEAGELNISDMGSMHNSMNNMKFDGDVKSEDKESKESDTSASEESQEITQPTENMPEGGMSQPNGEMPERGMMQPDGEMPEGGMMQPDGEMPESGMMQPDGEMPEGGMMQPNGEMPEDGMAQPNGEMPEGGMAQPNGEMPEGGMAQPNGEMPEGKATQPDGEMTATSGEIQKSDKKDMKRNGNEYDTNNATIYIILCGGILIFGICFAYVYKRRGK